MGEIFNALEVLNRTMKLGLTGNQLLGAEMGFKSALAMHGNPDPTLPSDPIALAEGYEMVATLRARTEPLSLGKLSTLAGREVTRPRVRVDAKTVRQINKALAETPREPVRAAATTAAKPTKAAVKAPKGKA